MKKLALFFVIFTSVLLSCKDEAVPTTKEQYGAEKIPFLPTRDKTSARDLPPEWPEGEGGAGGDLTYVIPPSPVVQDGLPFILQGKTGGLFTVTGGIGEFIVFGSADPTMSKPALAPADSKGLIILFATVDGGVRYIFRGYVLAVKAGQIYYSQDAKPVNVIVSSAGIGQQLYYVPTTTDSHGNIIELAHYSCYCNANGELQGQLKINQLSMNAQGQITLNATATVPGKTLQISKVNWKRWY
jgi:hypothetical protein